jgi:hypothetical protein
MLWRREKFLAHEWNRSPVYQYSSPQPRHYIDWAADCQTCISLRTSALYALSEAINTTRQVMYINLTMRCVRVTIVAVESIQHAKRIRHVVVCGMSECTVVCHIISQTERIWKKKVTESKMCFDYLYKFCLKHFPF